MAWLGKKKLDKNRKTFQMKKRLNFSGKCLAEDKIYMPKDGKATKQANRDIHQYAKMNLAHINVINQG